MQPQPIDHLSDQLIDPLSDPLSDERIACSACDLLYTVEQLPNKATATCQRCGTELTTRNDASNERIVIFSSTALLTLVLALSFPFMEFSRSGFENTTTLPQIVAALWINGMPWLSGLVGAFIIVIPAATMLMLLIISSALTWSWRISWLRSCCSLVFHCTHWSMAEVFFVGVLVSLIKIAKMATVVLGPSFWAYSAFTVLFILALVNLDRFQTWQQIDRLDAE